MQPLSLKSLAPCATGPLVAPTRSGGTPWAANAGDQGACSPASQRVLMIATAASTIATAHGRRLGLRSPLLPTIGRMNNSAPNSTGPSTITKGSAAGGINASTAKYQRKYQSG